MVARGGEDRAVPNALWIRLPLVGVVVGAVAVVVMLGLDGSSSTDRERSDADAGDCGAGPSGSTRLSAYEWGDSTWRTASARSEFVRTARTLCLDRVYVDVTAAGAADATQAAALANDVAELVRVSASQGLEVGVVAGDPWWPTEPGRVDAARLLRFVNDLIDDGVDVASLHLDVEPWGLEEWSRSKVELLDAYLRFVAWTERTRVELGLVVPVAYLIPYWFDGGNGEVSRIELDGRTAFPLDHLVATIGPGGSLSVMAYRDRANGLGGIVDLVADEVDQRQVTVLVGVETTDIDPPTATFAGSTTGELLRELAVVAEATGTEEIVVNDVDGLRRLAEQAGSPAD
jgi:hypothetical protein